MSHSPSAIANEFVKLAGHPLAQMKMQKLTFIANGWNLVISGEPLVDADAEAWDNPPVYREIWDRIRDLGTTADGKIRDYARTVPETDLTPREAQVVSHVWKRYGGLSASKLSEMTHQPGTPWTLAYFGHGRNTPISEDDIRRHYREIALAARTKVA